MKHLKHLLLVLTLLALPACSSNDFTNDVSPLASNDTSPSELIRHNACPKVEIVDELSVLSDFGNAKDMQSKNLASHITISKLKTSCTYTPQSVSIDLQLVFQAVLGSKGRSHSIEKPFFSYPYFIAITTPNGSIMAKEIFAASMTFNRTETEKNYYEGLRQIIPISDPKDGQDYKIIIGFQLTEEQLAYNRAEITREEEKASIQMTAIQPQEQTQNLTPYQIQYQAQKISMPLVINSLDKER